MMPRKIQDASGVRAHPATAKSAFLGSPCTEDNKNCYSNRKKCFLFALQKRRINPVTILGAFLTLSLNVNLVDKNYYNHDNARTQLELHFSCRVCFSITKLLSPPRRPVVVGLGSC